MPDRLRIQVTFPLTHQGRPRIATYFAHTIPRVGDHITTDGDDSWGVIKVTHIMDAPVPDVCALIHVQRSELLR